MSRLKSTALDGCLVEAASPEVAGATRIAQQKPAKIKRLESNFINTERQTRNDNQFWDAGQRIFGCGVDGGALNLWHSQ